MDREANLPLPSLRPPKNLVLPATNAADTTSSSSSSFSSSSSSSSFSSSSSPPDFLRHFQAAFKRHRSLGIMQTNNSIKPRRTLIPQREASRSIASNVDPTTGTKKSQGVVPLSKDSIPQSKNPVTVIRETHEDASPFPGTITKTFDESSNPFDAQREQPESVIATKEDNQTPRTCVESQLVEGKRKVQFATVNKATSQGADDGMATGLGNLSSHMGSLALTEMEWDVSNQVEVSNVDNDEMKQQNFQNMESDVTLRSDGAVTSLAKRAMFVQDQLHQLRNFLNQPATQSSVVGPSCATTTSVNSTSAPMLNSTTYCSRLRTESGSQSAVEPLRDSNVNSQQLTPGNLEQLSHPLLKDTSAMLIDPRTTATQPSTSAIHSQFKELDLPKEQKGSVPEAHDIANNPSLVVDKPTKERGPADDGTDVQPQRPMSRNSSLNVKLEPSKPENKEKVASSSKGTSAPRKRSYDPDLFFKVNGKLYQRLGKIGSGGSSEVHKVISSDCTIYALKKIKLKGRDYGTAYGFCQEILYLNKLKGKNNIIQLIDYEVTDKALLHEVMNSSMSNKDGRVKDDGCIYMVLEYGEIDLAHMLAQKWKEMDSSNQTIDDNWLRFYWQQILQAVNTIHEERIVHSDLKPANFLLVKGSLKLIDFGIAKAIMSDTTNIQRDSQVGTLSYMSPEAFMCNESDANGNTIKCGRPSDIWSLGCILYQMVYGRTPFSEYKTFWAKFKVITDPNHEITYEPVSNPWLLDLMKKCLAWDRNERWRIPQLLQHPFLVPPIPAQPPVSQQQGCKLLQLVSETCGGAQEASMLCRELQQLLNPDTLTPESLTSRDQQCKLLSQMSMLCFQLRECLAKLEGG